jgi:hypothetical protein
MAAATGAGSGQHLHVVGHGMLCASTSIAHCIATHRQQTNRQCQESRNGRLWVRQRWSKSAYPRIPVTIDKSLRPSENVATRCIERFRGRISLDAFSGATWRRTKGTFLAPSCERRCGRGWWFAIGRLGGIWGVTLQRQCDVRRQLLRRPCTCLAVWRDASYLALLCCTSQFRQIERLSRTLNISYTCA